jgi:hypothetical protein
MLYRLPVQVAFARGGSRPVGRGLYGGPQRTADHSALTVSTKVTVGQVAQGALSFDAPKIGTADQRRITADLVVIEARKKRKGYR